MNILKVGIFNPFTRHKQTDYLGLAFSSLTGYNNEAASMERMQGKNKNTTSGYSTHPSPTNIRQIKRWIPTIKPDF